MYDFSTLLHRDNFGTIHKLFIATADRVLRLRHWRLGLCRDGSLDSVSVLPGSITRGVGLLTRISLIAVKIKIVGAGRGFDMRILLNCINP